FISPLRVPDTRVSFQEPLSPPAPPDPTSTSALRGALESDQSAQKVVLPAPSAYSPNYAVTSGPQMHRPVSPAPQGSLAPLQKAQHSQTPFKPQQDQQQAGYTATEYSIRAPQQPQARTVRATPPKKSGEAQADINVYPMGSTALTERQR